MLALNTATEDNGYYAGNLEIALVYRRNEAKVGWRRYLAFDIETEFKTFASNARPLRLEIGSYGYTPSCLWRGQAESLKSTEKEYDGNHTSALVLDLDLKDYNDIRPCTCKTSTGRTCFTCVTTAEDCICEWKNLLSICPVCWLFAKSAMLVIDFILRNLWGFTDFYFVFSGKKGIHCWILDPYTEEYTEEERTRFIQSFDPWKDRELNILLSETTVSSSKFSRSLDEIIELIFETVICNSNQIFLLEDEKIAKEILTNFDMINMKEPRFTKYETMMSGFVENKPSSWELWHNLKNFINSEYSPEEASKIKKKFTYRYVFPRLDVKVTKQIVHPKKSPFSVHPESNRVCIPLLPHRMETIVNFDPSESPDTTELSKIKTSMEVLEETLTTNSKILKQVCYCPSEIPEFSAPVIRTDGNLDEEIEFCASMIYQWLVDKVDAHAVIPPLELAHQLHNRGCEQCKDFVHVERKNTVYHWIVTHCWDGDAYSVNLETALKIAWLVYLSTKCHNLLVGDEVLQFSNRHRESWKL